jgi:hypothetical protein
VQRINVQRRVTRTRLERVHSPDVPLFGLPRAKGWLRGRCGTAFVRSAALAFLIDDRSMLIE